MSILLIIIVFILGACFGSFVNMLEYRLAVDAGIKKKIKNKKVDKKFSFCDCCGSRLHWYENIPIISWVLQGGKTRCCHKRLSNSYPMVEFLTGTLFVLNLFFYTNYFTSLSNLLTIFDFVGFLITELILVILVFSLVFDLKYMLIFDAAVLILSILAVVVNYNQHSLGWGNLVAAVVASGFLFFLYLITKKRGMGLGDVELAVFMGLFLGWQKTIVAFYVAFISGAIWGLILIGLGKVKIKSKVPFGPFLILGTVTAWWLGDFVINFIYRWL